MIYLQPGDQVCYLGEWLDVVRTQRDAAGNRMLVWVDEVVGENAWGPVYKVLFFTAVAPDGGPVLVRSIGGRLT